MPQSKQVVVFTQPDCPPCLAVKKFLAERGISYIEKDVSQDQAAVFELVRKYNSRSTPTVVIGGEVLIGFNPDRIEELLGIRTKNPTT